MKISHQSYYTHGGIETIDFIKAKLTPEQYQGFLLGCTIKYLSRYDKKNEAVVDIKKAQWYLNALVKELEK